MKTKKRASILFSTRQWRMMMWCMALLWCCGTAARIGESFLYPLLPYKRSSLLAKRRLKPQPPLFPEPRSEYSIETQIYYYNNHHHHGGGYNHPNSEQASPPPALLRPVVDTTLSKRRKLPKRKRSRNQKWNDMIQRLRSFYNETGHSVVTRDHPDTDLYQWTLTMRRNYRHQALGQQQQQEPQQQQPWPMGWSSGSSRNDSSLLATPAFESSSTATATAPTTAISSIPSASSSTTTTSSRRPRLAPDRLQALQELDFPWDIQSTLWQRRYQDLCAFAQEHGHCRVPANCQEYPGLGIWVRNQRREYRKLVAGGPQASTSTLYAADNDNNNRLQALQSIGFEWYKSHDTTWDKRYQQLLAFWQEHGHSNVPEQYPPNVPLGQWCMNQRTAYKRYCYGQATALNQRRIQKLQDLGFVWNYRQHVWHSMQERLKVYYQQHGHLDIGTADAANQDLRLWLVLQRHLYQQRHKKGLPSPLTRRRIESLERAIPDFSWTCRRADGPKTEDWKQLFDAMREKGIKPDARPKEHWFEGVNPFSVQVKDTWTEQELLELWNQEDSDDDDI